MLKNEPLHWKNNQLKKKIQVCLNFLSNESEKRKSLKLSIER